MGTAKQLFSPDEPFAACREVSSDSARAAGFGSRGNASPRAHAERARADARGCPLVLASRAEGQFFADA